MSQKLVSVVHAVRAVSALKRRPEPWRPVVTYFSIHDIWLYQAVADAKVCELCRRYEEHGEFHGNHLRRNFPYLEILDVNTIAANVHPNCRCYLIRLIEEEAK